MSLALCIGLAMAGCAERPARGDASATAPTVPGDEPQDAATPPASTKPEQRHEEARPAPEDLAPPAAAAEMPAGQAAQSPEAGQLPEDEFYDPFARPGEQPDSFEEYDPWEKWNVAMFNFNRRLDTYVVKPVAQAYDAVMPDGLERSISRGFYHIGFPARFVNHLLQGKFKGAGIELTRFVLNTIFGLGGTLDFSKDMLDLEVPPEDTGQTFGYYGVKPGPFLILPIFPQPLNVRDGVGYLFDVAMNPMNYFLPFTTLFPLNVGYQLNERSINLETFQGVEEATIDLYAAVRNAYLQKRRQEINR